LLMGYVRAHNIHGSSGYTKASKASGGAGPKAKGVTACARAGSAS
jgi:hypothetical protein